MAVFQSRDTRTFEAGGDLSAGQFKFVVLAADGQIDLATDGAAAVGVLLNEPDAAGKAATVVVSGKTAVTAGGSITAGDDIASDLNGTQSLLQLATSSWVMPLKTVLTVRLSQSNSSTAAMLRPN